MSSINMEHCHGGFPLLKRILHISNKVDKLQIIHHRGFFIASLLIQFWKSLLKTDLSTIYMSCQNFTQASRVINGENYPILS